MKAVALCAALLPLASAFLAPAPAALKAGAVRARGGVEMMAERSKSLPFLMKPPMVRGLGSVWGGWHFGDGIVIVDQCSLPALSLDPNSVHPSRIWPNAPKTP